MILFYFSLLLFSCFLLVVSLWQIEIATGWAESWDAPFYVVRRVNRWVARDFWYAVNVVSWVLAVVSSFLLGSCLGGL